MTLRKLSLARTLKPGHVAPNPTEVQTVIGNFAVILFLLVINGDLCMCVDLVYDVWDLMREPEFESVAGKRNFLTVLLFNRLNSDLLHQY